MHVRIFESLQLEGSYVEDLLYMFYKTLQIISFIYNSSYWEN